MNNALTDIVVGCVIFVAGLAFTIRRFGTQDRLAFTIVAVLSPLITLIAFVHVIFLQATGTLKMEPCPAGLEEAELIVERQRQIMFGGTLRKPTYAASWRFAYERVLQRDTDRVQRMARRYFGVAA